MELLLQAIWNNQPGFFSW